MVHLLSWSWRVRGEATKIEYKKNVFTGFVAGTPQENERMLDCVCSVSSEGGGPP
jgi:hypothetical protein